MKAVPRMAENKVAQFLSDFFVSIGLDPVERVPVTGRKGPDISLNDFKLAVDVKSRLQVPCSWLAGPGEFIFGDGMVGVRISDVGKLGEPDALRRREVRPSVIVRKYLDHQHEWTVEKCKHGISAIALRRPGMRMDATTVIIYSSQEQKWHERVWQFKQIQGSSVTQTP